MEITVPIAIAAAAAFLLAFGAVADDRRARVRRRIAAAPLPDAPLLHSINDDRCIGCEACIDVCPTEVLELVQHKARVVRFSDCVQCEQCANACPTTALVMYREGSLPQTLTVPELDEHFQTGVPGQYLIGEVAGKPLVKNAANLGRAVIEHIARTLPPHAPHGLYDVVIVGSGPGGLSAGLTCLQTRLSCVLLEKEHVLASTVARYPKGKLFMAEPVDDRNVSYLPVFDATKEELVAAWQRVVAGVELPVKLGEAVESVTREDDGTFTVKSTVSTYRSRTVVLATGLRGKPRLLAVPGANLEKVKSRLDDPDELAGRDVLVVGGGDSAVEAAIALAEAGATVTLSYRGDGFKRCKQANQSRLAELAASRALSVHVGSNVLSFEQDTVTIQLAGGAQTTIANHEAFVLIGADTPVAWLETTGVRFIEREHLYALGSTEDVVRAVVPDAAECPRSAAEALAILQGKPRASHGRLHSIVEHIGDEFRDVVTSVTGVFRIADIEGTRSGKTTGSTKALRAGKTTGSTKALRPLKRAATKPGGGGAAPKAPRPAPLVPAANLTRRPSLPPPPRPAPLAASNPFEPESTVRLPRYGQPTPRPLDRPAAAPPAEPGTTQDMLSVPARLLARQIGEALAARAENPFENDPTTISVEDSTVVNPAYLDEISEIRAEVDHAIDNLFDHSAAGARQPERKTAPPLPPPSRTRRPPVEQGATGSLATVPVVRARTESPERATARAYDERARHRACGEYQIVRPDHAERLARGTEPPIRKASK